MTQVISHETATDHQQALAMMRPAGDVMKLERMGAFFPHRLSFMRSFIRRIASEGAQISCPVTALDENGFGHIVLSLPVSGRIYSLIAYSRHLDDGDRTDRVIATKWDASFCLFDGVPSDADIAFLADHVTTQEQGHYHERVLTLSRANKSVRLFQHVIDALSTGVQPDPDMLFSIGYLMRTTAVYGNGKFGIADRNKIMGFPGLEGSFQAEMLTVYLIREFSFRLVEHCAAQKAPSTGAAALDDRIKQYLGIGNSTGLGMAPFLVTHPCLLHSWIVAREYAVARIRMIEEAPDEMRSRFAALIARAHIHVTQWQVADEIQQARIDVLREEVAAFRAGLDDEALAEMLPFDDAFGRVQAASCEMQELLVSVLIEISPERVDGLESCMSHDVTSAFDPKMTLEDVGVLLDTHYGWADSLDLARREAHQSFWYTSEEKLEPRLGNRYEEDGAALEMPFAIPFYIRELRAALSEYPGEMSAAELLLSHPHLRYIVRRIQTIAEFPYGEIQDNLVDAATRPIDLLRCKLSFFGASKFDPKSDKWTRITLYQGAPHAGQLATGDADDWLFPLIPDLSSPA